MDSLKISNLIKEIRKKNNLTQKDLADKYNVTYQAVSKWENGKNLPDITLIRDICNDFNIDISDVLDLKKEKKRKKELYIILIIIILVVLILFLIINHKNNSSFEFKTISTTCSDFKVSGSLAYDNKKSTIYISNINYCGEEDNNKYDKIECNLYERNDNINILLNSCSDKENITLENYLKQTKIKINDYQKICASYNDNSLFLEINAYSNNTIKTYKIPLSLDDNCK